MVDATGAGMTVIVVTGAFAALGAWVGSFVGLVPVAGGILLGFIGLLAGVCAVIWRYRYL